MRRLLAAVMACVMVVSVACTPKPKSADPVVEQFFALIAARDFDAAGALTDKPEEAASIIRSSFEDLQAEAFSSSINDVAVTNSGSDGTHVASSEADFSVVWSLPRDREFSYDSRMVLTRGDGKWVIRWQPSVLYPRLGAGQHLQLRAINAPKASVVSSDGAAIIQPGTQFRVLVDKDKVTSVAGTATRISQALETADIHVPAAELAASLSDAKGVYSAAVVPSDAAAAVRDALGDTPGVRLNEEAAMVNVDPTFAPEIMARVSGLVGEELEGANGWEIVAVNANNAVIETLDSHDPQPAPAVKVSLNHAIQLAAQEAVDLRPEMKAMMVAIRPSTGEILAVAQTKKADEDGDIALNGQFPPGSTFKMITAAAGIADKDLSPDSIVPCPGTMNIGGRIVMNYNGFSRGNVPMDQAFAASCNTTFADISSGLQPGQLKEVAQQFGLGLDYDIPGLTTITGDVPEGEVLLDRTEAGYGQGLDLASPFGMALVASTAAAGRTPLPVLVEGKPTGVNKQVDPPSPEAIEGLRRMMRSVVTSGTARGMRAGGEVHGKTGEAEIHSGSHAWFAGYRGDVAFATLIPFGGGSESAVMLTDHFLVKLDELGY